ncbi:chymotrypsinogen A-like [Physella acuta]|uniref:chymotrypsinogen A-like n=1 Tax=Physella acuta TaxID=109671 RepID=UPI0027DC84BD|nr:chymotrypsinogen A-like [Physella acuta]
MNLRISYLIFLCCVALPLIKPENEYCSTIQLPLDIYRQYYHYSYPPPTLDKNLPTPPLLQQGECGVSVNDQSQQIVNGNDAPEKAWPWQVWLFSMAGMCGGSILTREWILTAAHCVGENVDILAFYGATVLAKLTVTHVSKYITRKDYDNQTYLNDIALLKLQEPLNFSESVRPICLPEGNIWDAAPCFAIGWGSTTRNVSDFRMPPVLQQLKVEILNQTLCQTIRQFLGVNFTDGNFCINSPGSSGVFQGDSGGSLSCMKNGRYYILGVTNTGPPIGFEWLHDAFTAVSKYVKWITETILAN